jgi:type IV secretion system protein VirB9
VLRVCVIELEPGEALVDEPIAGDQERWIITRARNGPSGTNALVVVKPKACDITTNLVLSTDRRIYNIDLESPPCRPRDTNPKQAFTRRIRFSYPDDTVGARRIADASLTTAMTNGAGSAAAAAADSTPPRVPTNREYRVIRERHGPFGLLGAKEVGFPWMPTAIEDDGSHVYITLPPAAKQHAAPVLYALVDDGSRTMLNFTLQESVIVTDRTFHRGLFVIVSGNREQTLTFENRAWLKTPASGRP